MSLDLKGDKPMRVLIMYKRLENGDILNKKQLADEFGVSEKAIQRDINSFRDYLTQYYPNDLTSLEYDESEKGYKLVSTKTDTLTHSEVVAVCKILLESRALQPAELNPILDKLLTPLPKTDKAIVREIIKNERSHYMGLQHNKPLLEPLWQWSQHIKNHEIVAVTYTRMDGVTRTHEIKPVSIIFSEFYFYLVAFLVDETKTFTLTFRLDRILEAKPTDQHYVNLPTAYGRRFEEGAFRQRMQFMYGGELCKVKFLYTGPSLEAVKDRLPTAVVRSKTEEGALIVAEVYGKRGIEMWLRSQGEYVECLDIKQVG